MVVVSCVLLVWQLYARRSEALDLVRDRDFRSQAAPAPGVIDRGRSTVFLAPVTPAASRPIPRSERHDHRIDACSGTPMLSRRHVRGAARASPSLIVRGKVVLITGANSGVGFVTARELARQGACVLMLCRDPGRGALALAQVAKIATGAAPELLLADMSSQSAVRGVAEQVRQRIASLDGLINNAGGLIGHRELTAEGIEKTFATNHLGAFLLTNLLLDQLSAGDGGRIVNVASEAYPSKLDFDNLQGQRRYNFLGAYFRSKLANIIFTNDLAQRLQDTEVTVNAVSPGPSRTKFGDNLTGLARLFPRVAKSMFPGPERGARTLIHLASSPEVAGVSGRFFLRQRAISTKPVTHDPDVAVRLWRICAELVDLPPERRGAWRATRPIPHNGVSPDVLETLALAQPPDHTSGRGPVHHDQRQVHL